MHKQGVGCRREEIVEQARSKVVTPGYFADFVPIGNAVQKLTSWKSQGADISYLTSRRKINQLEEVRQVLKKYNFPEGQLLFRNEGERYVDIVEKLMPAVLIEDDCESIGADEVIESHLGAIAKKKIRVFVVQEFFGIDHLSDQIVDLQ